MIIKMIQPNDLPRLSTFFVENNVETITCSFNPFELSTETARWIACESHQDRFYLGLEASRPVGFSMLRGWEEGFVVPSFGIFIDHRRHGQGFGKELLDLTIEEAQNFKCPKIRLSVYASNPSAHQIYRSRGFQEIERYVVRHNEIEDEKIVMMKDLIR